MWQTKIIIFGDSYSADDALDVNVIKEWERDRNEKKYVQIRRHFPDS